jgi:uncharacterized repeat protein (TIGR01451 family)
LNNTATATSNNNSPGSVQASATDIVLAPHLTVTKTPDAALVTSPSAVGFTITVSNSSAAGTGTAYAVMLSDLLPAPTGVSWTSATLVSGTAPTPTLSGNTLSDSIGNMAAGATVVFHVSGTAAAGSIGVLNNTATATPANGSPASGSATITVLATAQIAPTGTTAAQFANGTSSTLPAVFYTNDGTGHIARNVNPGVFFYFSYVTLPSVGGTINVRETPPTTSPTPFLILNTSTGNLALYDSTGTNIVASGTDDGSGNAHFMTTVGGTFIVLVKYDAKSIAGGIVPTANPVTYSFKTMVGSITQAMASVSLRLSGTQLAPAAGSGVGAASLTEQQLQPVVDEALARWAAAGLDAAQLSVLRNVPIHIATFLDAPRLGVESDGEIWLNADAAGWGWFTDLSPGATPAAGRMDLLTVVEHEFGHVLLGVQNGPGLMAATLAPGVRLVPGAADLGLAPRPAAAPANPAVPAPSLAGARDVDVPQTSLTPVVGVVPVAWDTAAAVLVTATSQATGSSVPTAISSNEQWAAALPAASQVLAYPVAGGDAGQRLAPYVLRPTSGQSAAADALDLLFSGGDATLLDDVPGVPFAGDHATPFDAGHDLRSAGEDAARLEQAGDALFGSNDGALTDTAYAVRASAFNPAGAVAMIVGLAGLWGAHRGDRSPEPEPRTWRPSPKLGSSKTLREGS